MDIFILTKLILMTFAVYGFSELVTAEDGPFNIFTSLREWLVGFSKEEYPSDITDTTAIASWQAENIKRQSLYMIRAENDVHFLRSFRGTLYGILSCSYCMSTWASLFFTAVLILSTDVSTPWPIIIRDSIVSLFGGLAGHRILKRVVDGE